MEKTVSKKTIALRMCIFALLVAGLLYYAYMVFNFPTGEEGDNCRERFNTFYAQDDNTIDCIFIGSSGTDRYWMPAFAYKDAGIASYELTTGHQHVMFTKYLMKEALKTQDIKLFAVDLRILTMDPAEVKGTFLRRVTDNMHFSLNRVEATRNALEVLEAAGSKVDTSDLSYYYRPIKYHAEWKDLSKSALVDLYPESKYMGYIDYDYYYKAKKQDKTVVTDEVGSIPEANIAIIDDLFEYCKTIDAQVIFFSTPMSCDKETQEKINFAQQYVEAAGYDTYNFNKDDMYEALDWDFSQDMHNYNHCNIFGAVKWTRYMENILMDKYGLTDHRGDEGADTKFADWESGFTNTMDVLKKHNEEYYTKLMTEMGLK